MQNLRRAQLAIRFVLIWFALSVGIAIASPIIKPQAVELICSASGAMKVVVKSDDGTRQPAGCALDCPLCIAAGAPPPVARLPLEPVPALSQVQHSRPAAHLAALTAAPLPARGPPAPV